MRKGGLRPPLVLALYLYFIKWDSFTMPTFEIFYHDVSK
jgi:hypothetical protein